MGLRIPIQNGNLEYRLFPSNSIFLLRPCLLSRRYAGDRRTSGGITCVTHNPVRTSPAAIVCFNSPQTLRWFFLIKRINIRKKTATTGVIARKSLSVPPRWEMPQFPGNPPSRPMQKLVFGWIGESRMQINDGRPAIYDIGRIFSNVGKTHDSVGFEPPPPNRN